MLHEVRYEKCHKYETRHNNNNTQRALISMLSAYYRIRRLVMKKNDFLIGLVIILGISLSATNVQPQQVDCYASLAAYEKDKTMANYACSCPNGRDGMPVCKQKSSSAGYAPSSGLSLDQQIAVGIAGALFQSVFTGMFNSPPASSSANSYQQQLRIQQEEQRMQEEQRKKEQQAALDAWRRALETAEQEALAKKQKDKELGSALLGGKMGGGITGGGGKLEPMWIAQKPDLKAIQPGGHRTSKLTQAQRLSCASYFSKRALEETGKGNYEGARFFNEQSDKVMRGAETDVECKFPQMPDPPTPKPQAVQKMEPEKFAILLKDFNVKLEELQDMKVELNTIRQEKKAAEENLKKIDEKIATIENQVQSAQKPEEKAEIDVLLQEALAARSDAENQVDTATKNEQEVLNKTKEMAKDIEVQLKSVQQQGEKGLK
jgi:hypothetical protein